MIVLAIVLMMTLFSCGNSHSDYSEIYESFSDIENYYATKNVYDLYQSDAFNSLVSPLLENITATQLQSLLTNVVPLVKIFIVPTLSNGLCVPPS